MFLLIEETNDWGDYIVKTHYKTLVCSRNKQALEKYKKRNNLEREYNVEMSFETEYKIVPIKEVG